MRLISRITRFFFAPDVAIDLGTANTRLFAAGRGLIADSPSVVGINRKTVNHNGSSRANNEEQEIKPKYVMPLEGGVVKNVPAASMLLKKFLRRASRFGFSAPRVIVCAPSDVSEDEREALIEANRRAGASAVAIVPEPLAAAIGAGLDVASPYAQMLVDIGEGVTDVAVVREGELIQTEAVRTGGGDLHRAVQKMIAERYDIGISKNEAEFLTKKLGAVGGVAPLTSSLQMLGANGSNLKKPFTVESTEVCEAINPVIGVIAETVRRAVRKMPPEACAEVVESGIRLTGGVAQLPGIVEFIAKETNLEVKPAPAPLLSVINGASQMLEPAAETNLWQA